jgi:hypothetical protein
METDGGSSEEGRVGHRIVAASGAALAMALLGGAACAQERPSWEVDLTPYLWLPGFSGDIGAVAGAPPTPVSAKPPEVFDHLASAGMISGEVRYQDFGILGDIFWVSVAGDHDLTLGGVPAISGKVKIGTTDATIAGYWRAYESDRFTGDLLLGTRYTKAKFDVSVSTPNRSASGSSAIDGWDVIVGARGSMRTGKRGSLSGYADFGGGSFVNSTWQVLGAYNWAFTPGIVGVVGWRFYGTDISRNGDSFNVTATGPLVGARFRFY